MISLFDIDDYDVGEELENISQSMEQLRNLVFMSNYNSEEKQVLSEMFYEILPIEEIRKWKYNLMNRQIDELTRLRHGQLLKQSELNKAVARVVKLDNT